MMIPAAKSNRRRGVALMIVVAALTILSILLALLVQYVAVSRQFMRRAHQKSQVEWLAESAISRATAKYLADREYEGELWELSPDDLGSTHSAKIEIGIESITNAKAVISARATYPSEADNPLTSTKKTSIQRNLKDQNDPSGEEQE